MKGVILAAGKGARMYPLTKSIPKPMLGVYDRPLIYFALEFMKKAGIDDVVIVVSKEGEPIFKNAIEDGCEFGLKVSYCVLDCEIGGTASAVKAAADFIRGEEVLVYYGDNLLLGENVDRIIDIGMNYTRNGKATVMAIEVDNPSDYGVLEIDDEGNVLSIEEKPIKPKSNLISPGIYFYPVDLVDKLSKVELSPRGEYELTDVNEMYLGEKRLRAIKVTDDIVWKDVGNFDRLLEASQIVCELEKKKEINL